MKKRIIALLMVSAMAVGMIACGNQASTEQQDNSQPVNEDGASEESGVAGDTAEVFKNYTDGLKTIGGTTFKMYGNYSEERGIYATIEAEDGLLYSQKYLNDECLVTVDYASANNNLNINSWVVENGEVQNVSSVNIEEFVAFNDDFKCLFSDWNLGEDRQAIMIESRGMAYSYADGVDYHITLIEIMPDGSLNKIYEDGLAGSGDEDITSEIRKSFNDAVGTDYSKDYFEEVFYHGKLIIEQENMPIYATVNFKSESGKLADQNDWDGANEIVSKIYSQMEEPGDPVYWGEGNFETK